MGQGQTQSDWRAVIENVNGVVRETDRLGKLVDDLGKILERIPEVSTIRSIGETEPGQVGCNHVIEVRQRGDNVTKHVRRRGKSVQQENGGGGLRAGLAVKDLKAFDFCTVISGHFFSSFENDLSGC